MRSKSLMALSSEMLLTANMFALVKDVGRSTLEMVRCTNMGKPRQGKAGILLWMRRPIRASPPLRTLCQHPTHLSIPDRL
ncbi:uncharacterized protein LOC126624553 [Malus sylvestris]|uniref:uncharacterized protein LOC126624553 n=1 Tax=Malus sylvestris TaxID=3752 RepID=UPI0021ACE47E|nr:uncharacterized protein LOC126624553 [Malus sylvestris]